MTTQEKLERAEGLLLTLCMGLLDTEIPLPPELMEWWLDYNDKPVIELIN